MVRGRQPVTSYTQWDRDAYIERGELSTIEAIDRHVQALGGHLDLVANFTDHTLTVTSTEAA